MRHWPLSVIAASPLMSPAYAWELHQIYKTNTLTEACVTACSEVASRTEPLKTPNLTVIHTEGGQARRIYLGRPDPEEWYRLERAGVVWTEYGVYVLIDGKH